MTTERVRVYACDYETTEEPIGPVSGSRDMARLELIGDWIQE